MKHTFYPSRQQGVSQTVSLWMQMDDIPGKWNTSPPSVDDSQNIQIFWKYPHPIGLSLPTPARWKNISVRKNNRSFTPKMCWGLLDPVISDNLWQNRTLKGRYVLVKSSGNKGCVDYLGKEALLTGRDPEAGNAGGGHTGDQYSLLYPHDLGHGALLLVRLLLGGRRHDLHVVLLFCGTDRHGAFLHIDTMTTIGSEWLSIETRAGATLHWVEVPQISCGYMELYCNGVMTCHYTIHIH